MEFNLNIISDIKNFFENVEYNDKEIKNFYYPPNKLLIEKIVYHYQLKDKKKILDVGGALGIFPYATHILEIKHDIEHNIFKVDIDFDKFPFENNEFEFSYCRHTIEDIQNPIHCLNEIFRTSNEGYIETPSPLAEFT